MLKTKFTYLIILLSITLSASSTCPETQSRNDDLYRYGPHHLLGDDCRKIFRRGSHSTRDLEILPAEKYFWVLKDTIQNLRDEIREDMIVAGADMLKQYDDDALVIDVTKHPEIAEKLARYYGFLKVLKKEAKMLQEEFKRTPKRRDVYIEQGMILDIKNESFEMNLSLIRSQILQQIVLKRNIRINDEFTMQSLLETLQNGTDPKKLRRAVDLVLDRSINDNSNPWDNSQHFLNYTYLVLEVDRIILENKGENQVGASPASEDRADRDKLRYANAVLIKEKEAASFSEGGLNQGAGIAHIYNYKNGTGYGAEKPFFSDYDGRLLYLQMMGIAHSDAYKGVSDTPMPETSNGPEQKARLEKKFELSSNKYTDDEKRILSESKSFTEHPELIADITKLYRFHWQARELGFGE